MTTTASMADVVNIEVLRSKRAGCVVELHFWCKNKNLVVVSLSQAKLDLLESSIMAFHIPEPGPNE